MFKTLFYTALTILFFQFPGNAQSHFSKIFRFDNDFSGDNGMSIQPYENGYLVAGYKWPAWPALAKMDENAVLSWSNVYQTGNFTYGVDSGDSPMIDSGFIYLGFSDSDYGPSSDIGLMCIERSTQNLIWMKKYYRDSADQILSILPAGNDAIWLVSSAVQPDNRTNLRLTKTDKAGNMLSDHFYDDYPFYFPGQACVAPDSGLLIAASVRKTSEAVSTGVLTKINKVGELEWSKEFDSYPYPIVLSHVISLNNGDIAFGWEKDTLVPPSGSSSPAVFILDSAGNLKKSFIFDTSRYRFMYGLKTLSNGDIMGVGWGSGGPGSGFYFGGWVFRMKPDGDLLWDRVFTDSSFAEGTLMDGLLLPDNKLLLTGYVHNNDGFPGENQVWMLKLEPDGCYGADCDPVVLITSTKEEVIQDNSRYYLVPNPARDYVFLKGFTGVDELSVEIFNRTGQKVKTIAGITSGQFFIGDLPAGDYTVKILLKDNRFATYLLVKS